MIGNDIIDLHQCRAETNWRRKGWVDKIFLDAERDQIAVAGDPEITVWLLWSMKEAAYKIYHRMHGKRSFAPKDFDCLVEHFDGRSARGKIRFTNLVVESESQISEAYIHTVAYFKHRRRSPSILIRPAELQPGAEAGLPSYEKDELGIPYRVYEGMAKVVSVSRHGRYEALVHF